MKSYGHQQPGLTSPAVEFQLNHTPLRFHNTVHIEPIAAEAISSAPFKFKNIQRDRSGI